MKNILRSIIFSGLIVFAGCQSVQNHENTVSHMQISSDEEFIEMMIPHHQEAIDSAQVILGKSQNEELLKLAQGIVDSQSQEIEQMETWGEEWFGEEFSLSESGYEAMMPDLSALEGEELDQAFISGMIGHHAGAVEMAEHIKEMSKRPELLELADAIIKAQTTEISLLKSWEK